MPSERNRRKDDTWTTDELNRALKGSRDDLEKKRHRRDGDERRHRDDEDRKERRRPKDDEKKSHRDGSEDKRRHRRDDSDRMSLTEEERERQRQERRDRREKKDPSKPEKKEKRRDAPVIEDDDTRRRHRDRDDEKRRHQDDDRDRHRDRDDDRRKRREEKERKHKDDGRNETDNRRRQRDEDDRDKRKKESREKDRHRTDDDRDRRRREKHEDTDDRDRQRQERREKKEKDRDKRSDRDEEKRDSRKGDKPRDRSTRSDDRHKDRNVERKKEEKQSEPVSRSRVQEPESDQEENGDEYNYDDEDFEDYDDDFEADDDDTNDRPQQEEPAATEEPTSRQTFEIIPGSEMDELLKAMDEENTRLANGSRHSNRSDSTDASEERYTEPAPKVNRGRTFIDFVSAKQVALNSTTASRTRKRGTDLQKMIELDVARYDMFDLPPVKEYEMYIRSFGRSNTKQAYIQTNEDNIDRDIQTDDIDTKEKWTQHPSEDVLGVGGDGIDPEAANDNQIISRHGDTVKLAKFVEKIGQTVGFLLDEERDGGDRHALDNTKSNVGFSDGFTQLGGLKFMEGRHVTQACFCPNQPNMLLTIFSHPAQPSPDNPVDSHGLACVWNINDVTYPHRILCCEATPTCCCFSPAKAALAFCGMGDGSVVVWDLREATSMHRTVSVGDQEHVLRFPTYNTARVLEEENHHSSITTIVPVYSTVVGSKSEDSSDLGSGLSFQLASVEQNAVVNLWVVAEISSPDMAGSESDLGLAPGGRIKLLKSSSVTLRSPNRAARTKGAIQAFEMQLLPTDLNHFYVGTDTGCVVHGVRFGSRGFPQGYAPSVESPVNVTTIDFSPFGSPYLLAGCDNGCLHLYHTKSESPLLSWPAFSGGRAVCCVRWSRSRPAVFYVLDEDSMVHVFDLLENDSSPVSRDQITPGRAVTMCLTGATPSRPPQLLLALDNGRTEVHTIIQQLSEQQTLEEDFIDKYVDKF
ncbi:cytoplasmic dynein 2 intermediate chain 1-like isoform X2 [Haliotis rufescens]|uniref:cytoplasmic dynein 2 intermediate chain 1-like isoform X2 n=1 Tax=Haliotis rufescens TaxID=6454 RepID=UPI00201E8359|nr:cytoplasmic dynein 2 intermediate chain 1-like isoform X2 [Haliotis rufescens]